MAHSVAPGEADLQIARMASSDEIDIAALRRMTPEQKLAVMAGLWRQAWALVTAGVRYRRPEWSDRQVADEVRAIFRRAGS